MEVPTTKKPEMEEKLEEVKPLREPQRAPEHCGRPMRRLSTVNAATGKAQFVHVCDKCTHQERVEIPGQQTAAEKAAAERAS